MVGDGVQQLRPEPAASRRSSSSTCSPSSSSGTTASRRRTAERHQCAEVRRAFDDHGVPCVEERLAGELERLDRATRDHQLVVVRAAALRRLNPSSECVERSREPSRRRVLEGAASPVSANSARSCDARSRGNVRGSGKPPANEMSPGTLRPRQDLGDALADPTTVRAANNLFPSARRQGHGHFFFSRPPDIELSHNHLRRSEVTSMYADIDPATGETVEGVSDDQQQRVCAGDAIDRINRAHRGWVDSYRLSPRGHRSSGASVSCTRNGGRSSQTSSSPRWASRSGRPGARSTSPRRSKGCDPATRKTLMTEGPIGLAEGEGSGIARRSSLGALLGIMHWRLPVLPGRAVRGTKPDHRQHDPAEARASVPAVGRGDGADLCRRRIPPRAPTRTSTRRTSRSSGLIADPRVRGVSVTGCGGAPTRPLRRSRAET